MNKIRGIAASGGISIGKSYCIGRDEFAITKRKISHEEISREIYRLEEALIETRKEIVTLQKRISKDLGFTEAKIFEAHLLVLEDRVLIEDVIKNIKNKRVNVEHAFSSCIKKYMDILLRLEDDYLKERVADIEDIGKRVLRKLLKRDAPTLLELREKVIIVAHDLSPAETADLPKSSILGFVTEIGGSTSHTAIIARSLSIPAVVGAEGAKKYIRGGETLIIDGTEGIVIVNPTDKTIKEYQRRSIELRKAVRVKPVYRTVKAKTRDGKEIVVSANIELPEELPLIRQFGAEGVGLYRTEYIFLGRGHLPTEEEQYQAYVNVTRSVRPHSVIIRTIDIGGDKFISRPEVPREFQTFLGWRAIRFCLARPDIFKLQLRAILRASVEGDIKIMFPMISGIGELRQAKKILEVCKRELKKEKVPFAPDVEVGAMIEVPSAALTAEILAKECAFFSIGTNDLIQYTLAVDRTDEKVAYLYEPAHPSVLRLIRQIIDAAHKHKIWVGMCGEMAGEAVFAFLLLGLGLDEFSMPPPRVPKIKNLIRRSYVSEAKKIAEDALKLPTGRDVEIYLRKALKAMFKDDFYKVVGL